MRLLSTVTALLISVSTGAGTPTPTEAPRAPATAHIGAQGRVTEITGALDVASGTTLYLDGSIRLGAGARLHVGAGARIEAAAGTRIHVGRDAFLALGGTAAQPIVLTCLGTAVPGCWDGIVIDGNAPINHGTATSPASRFSTATGCLQYGSGSEQYGGCDATDSSGVMRYVRIENAFAGVALRGVGQRTIVEHVQVHHSIGTGLEIVGGTVPIRYIALTINGQYGLAWRGGWTGKGQYIVVQQDPSYFAGGVLGQNGFNGIGDDAVPRSNPTLYNLTVVAESFAANPYALSPPRALALERGTAGTLRNVLLFAPRIGLDVDDAATCTQAVSGALSIRNAIIAGAIDGGDPDADAATCAPLGASPGAEAGLIAQPGNAFVTTPLSETLLRAGRALLLPDLRARAEQLQFFAANAVLPPSDGFFLQFPAQVSGLESSDPSSIPWYSGWTVGGALPTPPPSTITGTVTSSVLGAIFDARVTVTPVGATTLTTAGGAYTLSGLPGGSVMVAVSELPAGCAPVTSQRIALLPGASVAVNFVATCEPSPDVALDGGGRHVCGLDRIGRAWCWGDGALGQLGRGSVDSTLVPAQVSGGVTFRAITASNSATCALSVTQQAWCWGDNRNGQLGIGTADTARLSPTVLPTPLRFKAIAMGSEHICAISTADDAYCWGSGTDGKLGTGVLEDSSQVPLLVVGGRKWRSIAAGGAHSCGVTTAGVPFCWGTSITGALGNPGVTQSNAPVSVSVPSGVTFTRIVTGESSTCAVATSGVGYCWGTNVVGQLGSGSTANSGPPIPISGGLRWREIGMTAEPSFVTHTCGVTDVASVACWGRGDRGQLGQTAPDNCTFIIVWGCSRVPLPVSGVPNSIRVVTSLESSCALTTVGEVWCWGTNSKGQLGDGTTITRTTPAVVSGGVQWPRPTVVP
jgi:alpha-tubulin suppressor-like RCC1 family protein